MRLKSSPFVRQRVRLLFLSLAGTSEALQEARGWVVWGTMAAQRAAVANAPRARVGHKLWADHPRVVVPEKYYVRGAMIEDTALRAITFDQLTHFAALVKDVVLEVEIVETYDKSALYRQRLTWENVDMYSVCTYFVKPLTEPHKCSFVDLVSEAEEQRPKWFVSHAWSTPFSHTVSMLNFHRQSRALPPTTPYWICTFANNQHELGQLL